MNEFLIEILDPQINILEIETNFLETINTIEIERSESFNLEIINTEKILVGDLPDNIPLTKIQKDGLDGLDYYLDHYTFDCGTP